MFGTYCRLNLHVSASWRTDIKASSRTIRPNTRLTRKYRDVRHLFYRKMIEYHHKEQELLRYWRM